MAKCGSEAELELRVVCRDKYLAIVSYEAVANTLAIFASNGNILEIWVDT